MHSNFQLPSFMYRSTAIPLIGLVLSLSTTACGDQSARVKKTAQDTSPKPNADSGLTFNDIILEQTDKQGQTVWKVRAQQTIYSKDKKVARVQSPNGELFQDGKPVYLISGQQGEIRQNGEQLFLKGKIVATDPSNGVVLHGSELEWQPQKDLLIVRNQITGSHRQVQVMAQEARAFSRADRIELKGRVVATTNDPVLQLRTEQAIWQIREQKLISDRLTQIDLYKGKAITDRATGNASEYNLKDKIALLKQNAQLNLLDPPVQIASNTLLWSLNKGTVTADQPVRMVQRQQQMTVSANKGRMDLQKKIVYLSGDAYGVGQSKQTISAKAMTWYLPTQLVEAQGDVVYRQAEPPVSFAGQKAVGNLQNQNVTVSGGRVVTQTIP